MKIAMIVNSYPPRVGGLEYHIHDLAHALADLGHEVTVLTIDRETSRRHEGPVRVLTGRSHLPVADVISFPSLGTRRRLTRFLREGGFDVVSVHTRFFPMSFIGLRAAHRAGTPVIHTEHGSGFVASSSPVITLCSRLVDLTAGRYVLRRSERVLGVSQPAVDFVRRLAGVEAKVFYNAVVPPSTSTDVVDRPHHLVFVGRMVAGKGWDTFIDIVAELRRRGMDVDAEMLGDGTDLQAARDRITELALDEVIALRGRVSPTQVQEALVGSTLVNPSVLAEGFQTTILEAVVASGRVVSFGVPSALVLSEQGAPVRVC